MDLIGVSRTIDHAVYTFLNTLAVILWKINSALMGLSIASYGTTDWLTGNDNEGIWYLLSRLIGVDGMFGVGLWEVFLLLAIMLAGLSRVLRPFFRIQTVDLGRLLFFAVLSYVLITQGNAMMRDAERWRSDAGSYMYELMADSGQTVDLGLITNNVSDEPLEPPRDLDGESPLRGWEAVASSYFLATDEADLHRGVPPQAFLTAYCLYDPTLPIEDQATENAQGCSPRIAWDEWDKVSTSPITEVLGIPLPIDISFELPIVQEHPENRQLGIRQAQAGVARLMLGPVVALFPIVEANVSLMLTLAASFIYLSLPIVMLFGFFLQTEAMATRLMMQLLSIYIRTLILQGMIALFLLILIAVATSGSLTAYVGLIGVGLIGGFFLVRMAASITKETLSTALGAVGGIWTGANVALLGEGARKPAEQTFGAAKLAGTAATLGLAAMTGPAGLSSALELSEPALDTARSGSRELSGRASVAPGQQRGQMPPALLSLAAPSGQPSNALPGALVDRAKTSQPVSNLALTGPQQTGWNQSGRNQVRTNQQVSGLATSGPSIQNGHQSAGSVRPKQQTPPAKGSQSWVDQWYQGQSQKRGQQQITAQGRQRFGEELHQALTPVLKRRSQAQSQAVLQAVEAVEQEAETPLLTTKGQVSRAGIAAVKQKLPSETVHQFTDAQGQQDLEILIAAGSQSTQQVSPQAFQKAVAQAKPGYGDQAPAKTVPQKLGLDVVAAGSHTTSLNRFSRLSTDAGLDEKQKTRLIKETAQGDISAKLRSEIDAQIEQKSQDLDKLDANTVINSAKALPQTLAGPAKVTLSDGRPLNASPQTEQNQPSNKQTSAPTKQDAQPRLQPADVDLKTTETPTVPPIPSQPLTKSVSEVSKGTVKKQPGLGQQLNQSPSRDEAKPVSKRPAVAKTESQKLPLDPALPGKPTGKKAGPKKPVTKPPAKKTPVPNQVAPVISRQKPPATKPETTDNASVGLGQHLNQATPPTPPTSAKTEGSASDQAIKLTTIKVEAKPTVTPPTPTEKATPSERSAPQKASGTKPVAQAKVTSTTKSGLGQSLNQPKKKAEALDRKPTVKPAGSTVETEVESPVKPATNRATFAQPWLKEETSPPQNDDQSTSEFVTQLNEDQKQKPEAKSPEPETKSKDEKKEGGTNEG